MSSDKLQGTACFIPPYASLRPQTPFLVYLDLNKWIDLAHAETGSSKGEPYKTALKRAESLVEEGKVIFPLSFAHFMEVAKIGDDSRRQALARLMVRLSRGWFLLSASAIIMDEMRRAIASQFRRPFALEASSVLTRSIKEVFIDPKNITQNSDIDDALFRHGPVLEAFLATARVGPEFVARWQTFADQHEAGRALRVDLSRIVRKRAYCAVVIHGLQERLAAAFAEFGLSMQAVLGDLGPGGCVSLLESIPLLDVEINLHTERNEHRDREIQANDEIDLGFLSLAIPYCHAVVTEKFWTSLIRRLALDQKYQTVVGYDLNEILASIRPL